MIDFIKNKNQNAIKKIDSMIRRDLKPTEISSDSMAKMSIQIY